jgi:hypothetical protein
MHNVLVSYAAGWDLVFALVGVWGLRSSLGDAAI